MKVELCEVPLLKEMFYKMEHDAMVEINEHRTGLLDLMLFMPGV